MQFYKRKEIYRGDDKLYLIRYSLFSCKWFAIKVHHILLSDDDCLHDHPWAFVTMLLKGAYIEESGGGGVLQGVKWESPAHLTGEEYRADTDWVVYKAGNILYRKAEWAHRLILEPGKTVWSFVITFKKQREWGFFTPNGWVKWFKYRSTGSKCE